MPDVLFFVVVVCFYNKRHKNKRRRNKTVANHINMAYFSIFHCPDEIVLFEARWINHKSDAKLKKATKCGLADHVTKFTHPELGFLTIVAVEAVKEK